jgi:hypothetical protein
MVLEEGDRETDSAGMSIRPLTRSSEPLPTVSFVAAVPPESVSCVRDVSSVSAIEDEGAADGERVKTRRATRLPGEEAFSVNGIGFDDS